MSSARRVFSMRYAEHTAFAPSSASPPISATKTSKTRTTPTKETDPLGGYDPYSSSKACAEIVSAAYRQSYFPVSRLAEHGCAIATARAGNVIGGGDWSIDRLIPDLIRGFVAGEPVRIRSPHSIRPWQHVLEPLHGYILLAEHLLTHDPRYATAFNFGPTEDDAQPVSWIVERMTKFWGDNASWTLDPDPGVHEAGYLMLDAGHAREELSWRPRLNLETALEWLVAWYKAEQAQQRHARLLPSRKSQSTKASANYKFVILSGEVRVLCESL